MSAGVQAQTRAQLASVLIGVISQRLLRRKDGKGRIAELHYTSDKGEVVEFFTNFPGYNVFIPVKETYSSGNYKVNGNTYTLTDLNGKVITCTVNNDSDSAQISCDDQNITPDGTDTFKFESI